MAPIHNKLTFEGKRPVGKAKSTSSKPQGLNSMEDQKFEDTIYWGIIIASLIGIVVIAGFIVLNQANSAEANAFTAIYFDDYNKDVSSQNANFSFTIENHEAKETTYFVDINFDSQTVKSLEITLAKDQNQSQKISLPFNLDIKKVHKISINLRNRPESIHYWTIFEKEYPATFGDKNIAIIGFTVSPTEPVTGEDFNITYEWKCLNPTTENYSVFVHFVDSTGQTAFQNDHTPHITDSNGNQKEYQTSKCTPETTYKETYQLLAQKEGNYQIRIGLYTKETGRLQVDNDIPDNYHPLGTIKVQ